MKNATVWYEAAELLLGAQAKDNPNPNPNPHAAELLRGKESAQQRTESSDAGDWEAGHRRRLKMLVSAAALDASCNLKYYASVHFASQTGEP